jgi:hypothetical protein
VSGEGNGVRYPFFSPRRLGAATWVAARPYQEPRGWPVRVQPFPLRLSPGFFSGKTGTGTRVPIFLLIFLQFSLSQFWGALHMVRAAAPGFQSWRARFGKPRRACARPHASNQKRSRISFAHGKQRFGVSFRSSRESAAGRREAVTSGKWRATGRVPLLAPLAVPPTLPRFVYRRRC